jgi:hypothetical protein
MKKAIIFLFTCGFISTAVCQALSSESGGEYRPVSFPSSPTASIMSDGVNYNYPVKSYTGATQMDLPLYTYHYQNFSLDLGLNYLTKGVKVADLASWVGLNWGMNGVGAVTRKVMGKCDEAYYGWLSMKIQDTINGISEFSTEANAHKISLYNTRDGANLLCDWEPDVYSFNFNQLKGKFYFDKDRNIKLVPYQNLKITYTADSSDVISPGYFRRMLITSFTITDPQGIQYLFSTIENVDIENTGVVFNTLGTDNPNYLSANDGTDSYKTSWQITKIIFPNAHEILFSYSPETYYTTEQVNYVNRGDIDTTGAWLFNGVSAAGKQFTYNYSGPKISAQRLSRIEDDNARIDFMPYYAPRLDLANSYNLDQIKVFQKRSANVYLIKQFNFFYHYYQGFSESKNIRAPYTYFLNTDNTDYAKRLMLDSIQESGPSGPAKLLYDFEYDEAEPMPTRFTLAQDFWGYYNKAFAQTIFPKLYIYPNELGKDKYSIFPKIGYVGLQFILPGANRNPNPLVISLGTLNKITYATGGYTTFEYEPNQFYYDGANRLGSGIRVKKTTTRDNATSKDIIKLFRYVRSADSSRSSGLLINMPSFAVAENTHAYLNPLHPVDPDYIDVRNYSDQTLDYYHYFLSRHSSPMSSINGNDGIDQGYTEVVETNADSGSTYFKFSLPGFYGQSSDDVSMGSCSIANDGYCDGLYTTSVSRLCPSYSTYLGYFGNKSNIAMDLKGISLNSDNVLPFATNSNYEWNRGLIINEKNYDSAHFLLKEKILKYRLYFPNSKTSPDYLTAMKIAESDNWKCDAYYESQGPTGYFNGYSGVYFFAKYKVITQVAKVIESETIREYQKSEPTKIFETKTDYTYGGINHPNPTSIIRTDSKGYQRVVDLTYVFDLPSNITSTAYPLKGYKALQNQFRNPIVWNKQYYRALPDTNAYVTSAIVNLYDVSAQLRPFLKETRALEIPAPVLKSSVTGQITATTFTADSRYKTTIQVDRIDAYDNVTEYTTQEQKTALQWGYNNYYPVAKAINAGSNEIYYDGLESPGNFPGALYDSAVYHTGKYCAKIDKPSAGKLGYASTQLITVSLTQPTKYKYSGWVKSNAPSIDVILYMKVAGEVNPYTIQDVVTTVVTGNWVYVEKTYTVPANIVQMNLRVDNNGGGTIWFDDIRLHPSAAQLVSNTYNPLLGVTSISDINNNPVYYEYDPLDRLITTRDKNTYILKQYQYEYKKQLFFGNQTVSQVFMKNNCSSGIGSQMTYTVSQNTFKAFTQEAADSIAQADIDQNGQAYVNANGNCAPPMIAISCDNEPHVTGFTATLTNNFTNVQYVFPVPSTGGVIGSVPEGSYWLVVSKPGNTTHYLFYSCTIYAAVDYFNSNMMVSATCHDIMIDYTD